MKPTISIIIPARNEELSLDKVLSSLQVAIRAYKGNCETILVDNGSEDSTTDIARRHGCKVSVVLDGTIARLRNVGAAQATGDIFAFLDADCVVDKRWISLCAEKVMDDKIGLVGTRAIPDLENATWVEEGWYKLISGADRPDYPKWIGSSNMFIRRNVYLEVGGFDEVLETAEDVNFCNKIRNKYLICLEKNFHTIHLRESKTVYDLIKRELWRGKGSIRQFIVSNSRRNELLSIIVPFIINFLIVCTIILIINKNNMYYYSAALMIVTPIAFMIRKKAKVCNLSDICKVYFVAFYYIISRSLAMIYEVFIMLSKATIKLFAAI